VKNSLSFDVEEYFQVGAFTDRLRPSDWDSFPSRITANTEKTLALLDEASCHATFFVLGWVAEKYPQLVRRIAARGHEIACHSLMHRRVYEMTPAEFLEDSRRAKRSLEEACGQRIRGYRAPNFSLTRASLWAFEILAELGFEYDSSIFPVEHPNYGMPLVPRHPFRVETNSGTIVEFPMPALAAAGLRSPLGGGAYLRLLPYSFTRWGIRFLNEHEARPVCVYLHPWELDPDQPRIEGSLTARLRHYLGLRGTEGKLRLLLQDFEFVPLGMLVDECQEQELDSATVTGGPEELRLVFPDGKDSLDQPPDHVPET
jgi:polysaccharide deacetylase family protein (PEP-CTERM system associated)